MSQSQWVIDPNHSNVQFRIKYLVISSVSGYFDNFLGGGSWGSDDFSNAEIHFSIDVNSINTRIDLRDEHLRSGDFFDAKNFPLITFRSTLFKRIKGDKFRLDGVLTLKGKARPVEFIAEYGGMVTDIEERARIGFEVTGSISRWEFGLNYGMLTEGGSFLLGEDVELKADIQLLKEV